MGSPLAQSAVSHDSSGSCVQATVCLVHKHILSSWLDASKWKLDSSVWNSSSTAPPAPSPEFPRQVAQVPASSPALGVSLLSMMSQLKFCGHAPHHPACPLTHLCTGLRVCIHCCLGSAPRCPWFCPSDLLPHLKLPETCRSLRSAQLPTQCHAGCKPSSTGHWLNGARSLYPLRGVRSAVYKTCCRA